jgi:type I restriction enzyme S subunit
LITPNYTVFKPERDVVSRYFELLFHTRPYRDAFSMTVYGVTEGMSPLYTQDFYSIPTVAPPHREQARIVAWIDEQTMREEAAIRAVEREIELVREYRIRLVADLVTGKLDVREAAARLPQEVEDLEPLDKTEDEDYGEENDGGDGDGVREEVEA